MTSTYTVTFNEQNFISAINILGFQYIYYPSKTESKNSIYYTNKHKAIYIEIRQKPFCIQITNKKQSFTENSYERAYNIIHGLI